MTHFTERCLTRGITKTDPNLLQRELEFAVRRHDADHRMGAFVEKVKALDRGLIIWRFRCQDGIFHALMDSDRAVTLLTAQMVKQYRAISKGEVKGRVSFAARELDREIDRCYKARRARLASVSRMG